MSNNTPYMPTKKIDNISKIIGTGPNTIKIIHDFMPKEDIDLFIKFGDMCVNTKKDKTHHWVVDKEHIVRLKKQELFDKYRDLMRSKAEELYGLNLNKDRDLDFFVHPVGSYLEPHTDIIDYFQPEVYDVGSLLEQQEKAFPFLWSGHLSIITYLNDNYDGGILYFPDQDVHIQPRPGMLVMFPGNLHFLHGVTEISNNTRYTVSLWTRFSDFKNEIINEQ